MAINKKEQKRKKKKALAAKNAAEKEKMILDSATPEEIQSVQRFMEGAKELGQKYTLAKAIFHLRQQRKENDLAEAKLGRERAVSNDGFAIFSKVTNTETSQSEEIIGVKFEEALSIVKSNPKKRLVALNYRDGIFQSYELYNDEEEIGWIGVIYDGGSFFSDEGQEEYYSLEEAESEIKHLAFSEIPFNNGSTSEYYCKSLLDNTPVGISNPDLCIDSHERNDFVQSCLSGLISVGYMYEAKESAI